MSRRAAAAGSQSSLREANRNLVVETVKRFGGLTQVELAAATSLSQATVSTIVRELLAAGVVDTATTTRSGRRAQMVTLARRIGLAAGVQIGPRHLRIVLGDFSHQVIAEQTLPLPAEHRVDTSLDRVALLVVDLVERVGASLDDVVGLGVGLPAPVDASTGMVSVPGIMAGWDTVHIGQVLAKRLGRPVYVDNDANLGAIAESTLGAARPYGDSVFVRASYGTGAGIVINGQVHRGVAGTAGEIGHVPVAFPGELCRCGNRGCLDTVVGAAALIGLLRESSGPLTLRDVVQRAIDGDERCCAAVAAAGAMIGTVVAGLGVAVNPQVVVVGGELAETGETLLRPLREEVRRRVLPNHIAPLEVVPASLGSRAEVIGALVLAVQSTSVPLRVDDDAPVGAGTAT
ncbi:ROK family transcriptional regulator [Cellulomonas fengjieae]|uniref:ROK family transcriptional regulator n=1 Tax=Cellulomonas fengjieae TaxID=2819978 RepID=A0ABS3SGI8_9CELL|nr:ROK family transcriptional regulator [Cellulomonas fengjieae]MBO3084767.1 ROK family transcriptional regulator [Cellulomonas fengjieae]MBO3103733.1 ROK family transcriptional regulator [Cellulomonas fengjieae]QVI66913.1 ROK family transcriptional regulator [Cellulomonas fengjieae]